MPSCQLRAFIEIGRAASVPRWTSGAYWAKVLQARRGKWNHAERLFDVVGFSSQHQGGVVSQASRTAQADKVSPSVMNQSR
jgi:hypothetical protein